MISVIIPTLNSETTLGGTFSCLVSPTVSGLVREVIVSDGGSSDETTAIAEAAGATVVCGSKGRGGQLQRGAAEAMGPWLLFLHSDTSLESGWEDEVATFLDKVGEEQFAAAFRFQLDTFSRRSRWLERMVAARCALLAVPYGDQGLLISKDFYEALGGFEDVAMMEDIDLVRRIGRRRMVMLRKSAVTSARRYQRDGYTLRILKNSLVLTLWFLRVPTSVLVRLYG